MYHCCTLHQGKIKVRQRVIDLKISLLRCGDPCSACSEFPLMSACVCLRRKQKEHAEGTAAPERVPLLRKVLLLAAVTAFILVVVFLLAISLVASFNPGAIRKHQHPG